MQQNGAVTSKDEASGGMSTLEKWALGIFLVEIALSLYVRFTAAPPTLWGLLPIVLYALLVLLGIDVVLSTLASLLSAILLTGVAPKPLGDILAQSLGSFIAVVGLIIIMGAGL